MKFKNLHFEKKICMEMGFEIYLMEMGQNEQYLNLWIL